MKIKALWTYIHTSVEAISVISWLWRDYGSIVVMYRWIIHSLCAKNIIRSFLTLKIKIYGIQINWYFWSLILYIDPSLSNFFLYFKCLVWVVGLWCLTPLSTIFQLHRGGNRSTRRKPQTCRKSLTNLILLF